jgi:lipopolysaccharide transport system permease protein/teichoic acid transport system permease protein
MRELAGYWTNRHLLASLARQELRRTYAGTAAGLAWAVLTPLVPLLCFTAVFSLGLRLPLGGAPYVLGFAAAYVPWVLISSSLSSAVGSMVGQRYLVKRVRFPLEIVPGSSILVQSLPHVILLALTIAGAAASGYARLPQLLLLPYFYACSAILALGLGLLVAALAVVVRDVQQVLISFINVWFWLTPVAWAANALPPRGQALLALNPAAYVVSGYRHALMPGLFAAPSATESLAFWTIAAGLMLTGIAMFRRLRPHFWECL